MPAVKLPPLMVTPLFPESLISRPPVPRSNPSAAVLRFTFVVLPGARMASELIVRPVTFTTTCVTLELSVPLDVARPLVLV